MAKVRKGLTRLIKLISEKDFNDQCLEFKYRQSVDGYSRPKLSNEKQVLAHRFSYCWYYNVDYETISEFCVMHSCDNPCCVNPLHLSVGTWADNNKDRANKQRTGVSTARRKLTKEAVDDIKKRHAISFKRDKVNGVSALAKEYNVDQNVIYKAIRGGYDDWRETKVC